MLFKTTSASVHGIDAYAVEVQVDAGSAFMKDFNVAGLPDIIESAQSHRARVRTLPTRASDTSTLGLLARNNFRDSEQ
jgi:hypothetical protein